MKDGERATPSTSKGQTVLAFIGCDNNRSIFDGKRARLGVDIPIANVPDSPRQGGTFDTHCRNVAAFLGKSIFLTKANRVIRT